MISKGTAIDTPANKNNMPNADHGAWVSVDTIATKIEEIICSKDTGLLVSI